MINTQSSETLQKLIASHQGITLEKHNTLTALHIKNDSASARIFLQGAQVTHFQTHGQKPQLWLSPDCDFQPGSSLRGGIPVCWPWIGDLEKNLPAVREQITLQNAAPAHGIARQKIWQLDQLDAGPGSTTLRLCLDLTGTDEHWPFKTRLRLDVSIAETLQLTLSTHNLDQQPFCFSSALHSYFAVSDCKTIQIEGLHNCHYIDAIDQWQKKTQQGAIGINSEVDRIYLDTPRRIELLDPRWHRQIAIDSDASHSAVIWNPWIEKSKRLSCFPQQGYRDMVCIETANAFSDFVTLAPGHAHSLDLSISAIQH